MPHELKLEYLQLVHKQIENLYVHIEVSMAIAKARNIPVVAMDIRDFELVNTLLAHCGSIVSAVMEDSPVMKQQVSEQYKRMIERMKNNPIQ